MDPEAYLGPDHVKTFGQDPGILVKLLDAGQRLSVQAHPDRSFVNKYLNSNYGKSEAWIILDTYVEMPSVYLGFREQIEIKTLAERVESQDSKGLLNLLNRLEISIGDSIYIPAGVPHAIGQGILMVEVQEPSDWLMRLEWIGFKTGKFASDMGLGFEKALQCVDRSAYSGERLEKLWFHDRR